MYRFAWKSSQMRSPPCSQFYDAGIVTPKYERNINRVRFAMKIHPHGCQRWSGRASLRLGNPWPLCRLPEPSAASSFVGFQHQEQHDVHLLDCACALPWALSAGNRAKNYPHAAIKLSPCCQLRTIPIMIRWRRSSYTNDSTRQPRSSWNDSAVECWIGTCILTSQLVQSHYARTGPQHG